MATKTRTLVVIAVAALLMLAFAAVAFVQTRRAAARQEQVRAIGADWQQSGLLSQQDYVRLHRSQDTVVRTRALSDQELDWLLATLKQSPSPIVHSRVMGILSTMANPPASQKEKIKQAITPLLQSHSELDSRYALRVQQKLGLAG